MKRYVISCVCFGVLAFCVLLLGFGYDMVFAGIPYQDPTSEMQARYDFHRSVAGWIMLSSLVVLALGPIVPFLWKKRIATEVD